MTDEELVLALRADADLITIPLCPPVTTATVLGMGEPACRCYRCGALLAARDIRRVLVAGGLHVACTLCYSVTTRGYSKPT